MNEILHANIFFFITGIAVIVFTALLCVAIFHIIKVLKSLRRILNRIEAGAEVISEDMQNVRAYFAEDGLLTRLIAKLVGVRRSRARGEQTSKKQDKSK